MVQELHRHNFFFVLALEKGKGIHSIDFVSYPVSDHSVFFMRPGQVHQLTLEKGSTGYLMQFNAGFSSPPEISANQVLRKVSGRNHCQFNSTDFKKLLSVLANISHECDEKQQKYKDVIKAYLEIFLIELSRQSLDSVYPSKGIRSYARERLEKLLELVETHIAVHKKVADYADMLHLTSYQINAITKETLGKTCSQLINEQVILEAKRNLLATSNQINEIADHLGYEDTSYFIRFFKKHTGFSPEAFRQNFK